MKQNINKYIIYIWGFLILWLVGIPVLFSYIIPIICENITYNSDYNVKISKPGLVLNIVPVACIKAESISIFSKDKTKNIYIKNPKIKLRLLPLLSGKVHINSVSATELNIDTQQTGSFDNNIQKLLSGSNTILDSVDIKNIKIKFKNNENFSADCLCNDLYYKKNGRYIKLNLNSSMKINNNPMEANINLHLPQNNDVSKSNINVYVKNFDIEPFNDIVKIYLPSDITNISGKFDIDINNNHLIANIKNHKILMSDDAKSMIFPQELSIESDFNLTRKAICINQAEIRSKNINMAVSGTVSNYFDKASIEENLSVRINSSRIEDFISLIPAFETEDIDTYALKKYKFYGNILGNLSIKGDTKEPSIDGRIYVSDGILTKPIPNAKGATVKLDFKDKYLNFDVNVPAGGQERVTVIGGAELYNIKYSDMEIKSTDNVDLATAEDKVVPLSEILNFLIGPVPIMDITGRGNIDITVKGNRKNPHVWGVFNTKNATARFKDIPDLLLSGADSQLSFDDENSAFILKNGNVDGRKFNLQGKCNLAGDFDFSVSSPGQSLKYLYNAVQTSKMIDEIKNMLPKFTVAEGPVDINMNIYGSIKDIHSIKFNENFFTKGEINLLGNSFELNNFSVNHTKGIINFSGTNADINADAFMGKSPVNFKAKVKDRTADVEFSASKLNICEIFKEPDSFQRDYLNIFVDAQGKYSGNIDNIEYDKADVLIKILEPTVKNKLKVSQGNISLKNGKLNIKDINGHFVDTNSSFNINLKAADLTSKPVLNGKIVLKDFELFLINAMGESAIFPENIRKAIRTIHFDKGKVNVNASINNNNINGSTDIGGIAFTYKPLELPIRVINGSIYLRKNYLGLNKINLVADGMPVLFDGGINNIFSKQDFDIYINSKPKQDFIDKYINSNRIYPIKIKGDIVYSTKIKGVKDDYNCTAEAYLEKDSSIFYLGAFVNDIENAIILNINTDIKNQNNFKIHEFSYDKLIDSLGKRKTRLNMLKASGGIELLPNDIIFRELKIKTNNPTDARIFNIIFRKPIIKQGQFTSDLKFNGKLSNPKLIGTFHIFEANIPFFDTTMKNVSFRFRDKFIELTSKGEVFGNDIAFKGVLKNKLTAPFYIENAELTTKMIDLNYITEKLRLAQVDDNSSFDSIAAFDIKNVIVKNMKLKADSIKLRNLTVENVAANASINSNQLFKIHDFNFKLANGYVDGSFSYLFPNSNMTMNINAKNINANDISIALFDLNNQIYGDLTGKLQLKCNGTDFNRCMSTLGGAVSFNVSDGRMPKLGSLEYLLKAGNLLKGGITGLSINSVIDIITPLKTGNFSDIYGKIDISDGMAKNIEIATKGKDLSLFITGQYNFATSEAEMEVLGLLSKKISTMFGPIGNVSLNTLFNVIPGVDLTQNSAILNKINKIPGIELNSSAYRKFIAEIIGNINGDNYVSSFKWIN